MKTNKIKEGRSYIRFGQNRKRTVVSIRDGEVVYIVEGLLSFMPLKMPIEQFADWAERPSDESARQ